jgi:hypothetical protein
MTAAQQSLGVDASGLRERLTQQPDAPQKASSLESAHETVRTLNEQEAKGDKDEKDRKTYGRTPDGTGEYFQCSPKYDNTIVRVSQITMMLYMDTNSIRRYNAYRKDRTNVSNLFTSHLTTQR